VSESVRVRLLVPRLVFVLAVALAVIAILYGTSGRLVFPIDDAYINIGLGRRFFEGTAGGEFPSGTTAFGWSLLTGALSIVVGGWTVWAVVLINVAGGFWILSQLAGLLPNRGRSIPETTFLLWAMLFAGLPFLAVLGMEHLWHGAFVIAALAAMARLLENGDARDGRRLVAFVLLAALCRQETMFLGIALAVTLAVHGLHRWIAGTLVAAFLPVVAQGALQLVQGKSFIANPAAIKGGKGQIEGAWTSLLASKLIPTISDVPLAIGLACLVLFVLLLRPPARRIVTMRAIAATTLMYGAAHMFFAQVGWLGRYQTPIIACVVTMLAVCFPSGSVQWRSIAEKLIYGPALVIALVWTATANERGKAMLQLPFISREVADQMCRIGDITKLAPKNEPVVMNDVGCTTFFLDNPIIDLYGLTSYEARALGGREYLTKRAIDGLARGHGAKMAIINKNWFSNRIPDDWVEIGHWTTATKAYAADHTVTVYATNPEWRDEVASRWRTYVRNAGKPPHVRFDD